jgi:hypothetical protein
MTLSEEAAVAGSLFELVRDWWRLGSSSGGGGRRHFLGASWGAAITAVSSRSLLLSRAARVGWPSSLWLSESS